MMIKELFPERTVMKWQTEGTLQHHSMQIQAVLKKVQMKLSTNSTNLTKSLLTISINSVNAILLFPMLRENLKN